ncbi:MAG: hypothetical protein KGL35_03525 [Bradyrhizobium sp.]|nr:hypothetical protein [Bradyrhizobium sp.]
MSKQQFPASHFPQNWWRSLFGERDGIVSRAGYSHAHTSARLATQAPNSAAESAIGR